MFIKRPRGARSNRREAWVNTLRRRESRRAPNLLVSVGLSLALVPWRPFVRRLVTLTLCVLVEAACANTSMRPLPAPELQGRQFRSVLVVGSFSDLGMRREMEDRFASHQEMQTRFVQSYALFVPGRQYSAEGTRALLSQNHIDATLVIFAGSTGAVTGYVPPTYTSGCAKWSSETGCAQVTSTQGRGYAYSKPWMHFTVQLYDAYTGGTIWTATATVGGKSTRRPSRSSIRWPTRLSSV